MAGEADIVMESTTDTPEQIAEGLELPAPAATDAADDAELPAADGGDDQGDGANGDGEGHEEPAGEVTAAPARVATPRQPRPQRKTADAAAAAARRQSRGRMAVLEEENDALRARLRELAGGTVHPSSPAATPPAAAPAVAVTPVDPAQVPDTHPRVAAVLAKLTELGPKPKQEDYPDFDEFEQKRDQWMIDSARLQARADFVREDVAATLTAQQVEANRAAATVNARFQASVDSVRSRHADYDDRVAEADQAGIRVSDDISTAIMESEIGGDLIYHLVSNPEEVKRLNSLSPHRQVVEIGKLESRLQAGVRRTATPAAVTRPTARTTRAPEPPSTAMGDFPSHSGQVDLNDPNLPYSEYRRIREEQNRQNGRSTH